MMRAAAEVCSRATSSYREQLNALGSELELAYYNVLLYSQESLRCHNAHATGRYVRAPVVT